MAAPHLAAALLCLAFGLSGCTLLLPPETGTSSTIPVVETPAVEQKAADPKRKQIDDLLEAAREAFYANRLTTPVEDNAYYRYLSVLAMDPGNQDAEHGLSDIVEKYLAWAIEAARENRIRNARDYLGKANSVDETHPSLAAVRNLIEQRQDASQTFFELLPADLSARSKTLSRKLADIGSEVHRRGATVVITARSDPEGRWVYQQMNQASEDRIRGEFRIGSKTGVQLIY